MHMVSFYEGNISIAGGQVFMTSNTSCFPVITLQWMACNLHDVVDAKILKVTFSLPILRISLVARILIRLKPYLITNIQYSVDKY